MGTCPLCGQFCQLDSYSTSAYLMLLGLPLIPLGRYRVVDQCSACRGHESPSLKQWEQGKGELTLESIRQHQQPQLLSKVSADNPGELGWAHAYFGQDDQAETWLRKAGDSPEVKARLGFVLLRRGRLGEGAACLDSVLREKREDLLWYLYVLVEAYQQEGQHIEAERLLDKMAETWPELADDPRFQDYEESVESGRRTPSAFLKKPAPRAASGPFARLVGLTAGPLAVVGLVAGYLGWSHHLGQAHPIYVANGLSRACEIEVQGVKHQLEPRTVKQVEVREGRVAYSTSEDKGEFTLETPFYSRPFDNRVYVVNPDRTAVLMRDKCYYSSHPQAVAEQPELRAGRSFYALPAADYAFRDFPQSVWVEHWVFWTIVKTRWSLLSDQAPDEILPYLSVEDAASYLIAVLNHTDPGPQLLESARIRLAPATLLALARDHLAARPVQTAWHELYQDVRGASDPAHDLAGEYRERLQQQPQDPELQYLLGRLLPGQAGRALLVRSTSPRARETLAREALARGNFAAAAELAPPGDMRVASLWGLGRWETLLGEVEDPDLRPLLLQAAGRTEEAEKLAATNQCLALLHYAQGKPAELGSALREGSELGPVLADIVDGQYERAFPSLDSLHWRMRLLVYATGTGEAPKIQDLPPEAAALWEHPHLQRTLELALPLNEKRVFLAAMARRDPAHKKQYLGLLRKLNFDTRFPYLTLKAVAEK